jgi:hypothetical protein
LVKVAESSCPMEKRGCGGVRCTKDQHMPICLALQIILKGQGDRSLSIRIFVGVCMILVAIPSTGQGPLGQTCVVLVLVAAKRISILLVVLVNPSQGATVLFNGDWEC